MSLQMKIVNSIMRVTIKPILTHIPFKPALIFIPRKAVQLMTKVAPKVRAEINEDHLGRKLEAEWINKHIKSNNVILYLHGGGYLAGSPGTHRNITSRLSKEANCPVLALEYGLAPEHKYPQALLDALDTYVWLLTQGYKPSNIAIAGDSAGGNLTLALTAKIIDIGLQAPAAIACISPWCDLAASCVSIRLKASADPMLPANRIKEAGALYAGDMSLHSSELSLMNRQSFKGFPPTIFHSGTEEILQDEMRKTFAKIKKDSINECVMKEWNGCCHVFQLFAGLVPEATQSIKEMGSFIKNNFE